MCERAPAPTARVPHRAEVGTEAGCAPAPHSLLILQLGAILVATQLVGRLFRWIGQPQVIGEMVAGILLGPSLLGALLPGVAAFLFPPDSLSLLGAISDLGLVLFLFVIGLEHDPTTLRGRGGVALTVSIAGKIGGATLAGRVTGLAWRDGLAVGVLVNTRGLVELVLLNIGLDAGLISPTLFTMMVLMAIVTTFMATPLLDRIRR